MNFQSSSRDIADQEKAAGRTRTFPNWATLEMQQKTIEQRAVEGIQGGIDQFLVRNGDNTRKMAGQDKILSCYLFVYKAMRGGITVLGTGP
jgi:hypothetical protein